MHKDNETCIQRAKVLFTFFETGQRGTRHQSAFSLIIKNKNLNSDSLRQFSSFLNHRLERIAGMMDILMKSHDDWAVTGRRDQIVMETESWDFNEAVEALHRQGYTDDEYILEVEYTRKWGVL